MSVVLNFDASTVTPSAPRGVIPAGDYNMALVAAETKGTNAKNPDGSPEGHYLALDYIIQGGEHEGRHVYDNLNLWNKSEKACKIAWEDMSALCHACGVLQVATADQLFGIMIGATIGVEAGDDKYGPSNTIKSVQALSNAPTMPGGFAPAQPPAAAPAPDASAPWNQQGGAAPAAAPATTAPAAPVSAPATAPAETPAAAPATAPAADAPPWAARPAEAAPAPAAAPPAQPAPTPAAAAPETAPAAPASSPPWAK